MATNTTALPNKGEQNETVIFAEFWPDGNRTLYPFEIVTTFMEPSRGGRPEYRQYHWYDCARMANGTLIYNLSGAGSLVDNSVYVTRGPFWSAKGLNVKENGERRVKKLPERFVTWPPTGIAVVEARIVSCETCGWVPDDGYCESPCGHLEWDRDNEEWSEKIRYFESQTPDTTPRGIKTAIRAHVKRALHGTDIAYTLSDPVENEPGTSNMELSIRWTEETEPKDAEDGD